MKALFFNNKGQSYLEVILALAILLFLASGVGILAFRSVDTAIKSQDEELAKTISAQSLEALLAVSYDDWGAVVAGEYGLSNSNGKWELLGTSDTINGRFVRTVIIEDVMRDPECAIVSSGGVTDDYTKLATITVDWITRGVNRNQQYQAYVNDWENAGPCGIPEEVVTVLDCGGLDAATIPSEILQRLITAQEQGKLSCITSDLNQNLSMAVGQAIVFGDGVKVKANISGGAGSTILFGLNGGTTSNGNIANVQVIGFGNNANLQGNYNNVSSTYILGVSTINGNLSIGNLYVEPNASASFTGNLSFNGTGLVGENAIVSVGGNSSYSGSFTMEPYSIWHTGGNFNCNSTNATIDPTASVVVDGSENCSAF